MKIDTINDSKFEIFWVHLFPTLLSSSTCWDTDMIEWLDTVLEERSDGDFSDVFEFSNWGSGSILDLADPDLNDVTDIGLPSTIVRTF